MNGDQNYLGRMRLLGCEMPRLSLQQSLQLQGQMNSICAQAFVFQASGCGLGPQHSSLSISLMARVRDLHLPEGVRMGVSARGISRVQIKEEKIALMLRRKYILLMGLSLLVPRVELLI